MEQDRSASTEKAGAGGLQSSVRKKKVTRDSKIRSLVGTEAGKDRVSLQCPSLDQTRVL